MTEQATIEAVPQLGEGFKGEVIAPGDLGYDDARAVWNGSIDRRPALIVRPVGAADVIDAVNYARLEAAPWRGLRSGPGLPGRPAHAPRAWPGRPGRAAGHPRGAAAGAAAGPP